MRASKTLVALTLALLALVSIAGCLQEETPAAASLAGAADLPSGTGGIHGPDDCAGLGQLREWDLYVKEDIRIEPIEGGRDLLGMAFGTSPEGPFSVPGPELRVTQCDTVRVRLHDPPTAFAGHTIHWHGQSVPWAMDGVPFLTQTVSEPGVAGVYTYEFVAWESGTYWYHCHVEAPAHADVGLFGAFIVEPLDPAQDPAFDREETLIFHEMDSQMFMTYEHVFMGKEPGRDDLSSNPMDAVGGAANSARTMTDIAGLIVEGATGADAGSAGPRPYYPLASLRYRPQYDTFMINGKSFPDTEPVHTESGDVLRLRFINAGQLVHTVHLHGHHFLVTHKDGYNLPAPYWADTLLIGPAERYDVYVHSTNIGVWDLHDHGGGWNVGGYTSNDHAFPGGMNTMLVYDDFEAAGLPAPEGGHTSGDYRVHAPSYVGEPLIWNAPRQEGTAEEGTGEDGAGGTGADPHDAPSDTASGADRPHAGVYRTS